MYMSPEKGYKQKLEWSNEADKSVEKRLFLKSAR